MAILAMFCLVDARSKEDLKCGKCDVESCTKFATTECLSGIIKDECGCCPRCAQMEGEPCDRSEDPYGYGPCGDGLACKSTEFGSFCLCQHNEIICGSDGITYSNLCQLMAAAVRSKRTKTLKVDYRGPCDPGRTDYYSHQQIALPINYIYTCIHTCIHIHAYIHILYAMYTYIAIRTIMQTYI